MGPGLEQPSALKTWVRYFKCRMTTQEQRRSWRVLYQSSPAVRATLIPKDKATPEERKIAETMSKECKMLLRVMSVIRVR